MIRQEEENIKGERSGKAKIEIYLFTDCMIIIPENPRESIIKLTQNIKEFSKLVGYKVYTPKSTAFIYKTIIIYRFFSKGTRWRFFYKGP